MRANAPGLYRIPAEPQRAVRRLVRADVPVFLGYAARGPVGQPVRLRTLSQFETLFGSAPGFLRHGVKAFFECGGDAAYVIRLASPTATSARVVLAEGAITWRAEASFAWPLIDPRTLEGRNLPGAQPWIALFEQITRELGDRTPDAGAWGNQLELRISETANVQTETLPDILLEDGFAVMVEDLTGLEAASILTLSQVIEGATYEVTLIPEAVDTARKLVRFGQSLVTPRFDLGGGETVPFDMGRPIRVRSTEFDFDLFRAGKLVQSFRGLSPNPVHSRGIEGVFAAESRWISLAPLVQRQSGEDWLPETEEVQEARLAVADWADAENWPTPGLYALEGGTDGLSDLTTGDYKAVLRRIKDVREAALIAAPDLVLQEELAGSGDTFVPTIVDCEDLTTPPENTIVGKVIGPFGPLPSVKVDPSGRGESLRTDGDGNFRLTGVDAGIVTLKLSATGYEPLEFLAESSPFSNPGPVEIAMTPITRPRIFEGNAVLQVQGMMANPEVVGPYKVAILDVPSPEAQLQDITTWRAQLGDLPRAVLAGPWLLLPQGGGAMPASCHLCGATAAAERTVGVHRTGANLALRHVEGTTLTLNDVEYGLLNDAHVTAMIVRPGQGIRAGGARTLAADPSLRFLSTRRILDVIERTLEQVLRPLVFEPNNLFTRQAILLTVNSLLDRVWQIGALAGASPAEAFTAKCDEENNPDETRADGQLIVDIGVAPTIPMEFIYFRLGHIRDITKVTEAQT